MTSRRPIFDAIRTARNGAAFTSAEVARIDALLDSLSIPGTADGLVPSNAALANIKSFESCKLTAYPDPGTGGDPWTIGWGSTGPGIKKGVTWTQEQADARFMEDVDKFSDGVVALLNGAPTTQGQFDALVSFAYNIGLGALKESTLLRLHKEGKYLEAAGQFGRWVKAGGQTLKGLVRRREAEKTLYQS